MPLPTFPFVTSGRVRPNDAGAADSPHVGIVEPAVVLARTEDDNRSIHGLDADIQASTADPAFKKQFGAFVAEWDDFAGKIRDSWWMRFQSGTVFELLRREEELRAWRAKFEAAGGKPTAPELARDPADPIEKMAAAALQGLTTGTILILGAAAAYFLLKR